MLFRSQKIKTKIYSIRQVKCFYIIHSKISPTLRTRPIPQFDLFINTKLAKRMITFSNNRILYMNPTTAQQQMSLVLQLLLEFFYLLSLVFPYGVFENILGFFELLFVYFDVLNIVFIHLFEFSEFKLQQFEADFILIKHLVVFL